MTKKLGKQIFKIEQAGREYKQENYLNIVYLRKIVCKAALIDGG